MTLLLAPDTTILGPANLGFEPEPTDRIVSRVLILGRQMEFEGRTIEGLTIRHLDLECGEIDDPRSGYRVKAMRFLRDADVAWWREWTLALMAGAPRA